LVIGLHDQGEAEEEVLQQLTTGYTAIDDGDRAAVYGEAVLTYVNSLVEALPRADGTGTEKRGGATMITPAARDPAQRT
jgi:hypothetical protein